MKKAEVVRVCKIIWRNTRRFRLSRQEGERSCWQDAASSGCIAGCMEALSDGISWRASPNAASQTALTCTVRAESRPRLCCDFPHAYACLERSVEARLAKIGHRVADLSKRFLRARGTSQPGLKQTIHASKCCNEVALCT